MLYDRQALVPGLLNILLYLISLSNIDHLRNYKKLISYCNEDVTPLFNLLQ